MGIVAVYGNVISRARRATAAPHRGDTRITLLRSRLPGLPIYHVALLAEKAETAETAEKAEIHVMEHGPVRLRNNVESSISLLPDYERVLELPSVPFEIHELQALEAVLPKIYLLGVRDCRHHVIDILDALYPVYYL